MDIEDELEKWHRRGLPQVMYILDMYQKHLEYQRKVKQDKETLVKHIISHIYTDLERDLDIEPLSKHDPFGSLANATSRQDAIKQLYSILCRHDLSDYCLNLVEFVKALKSTQQDHLVDKVMKAFDSLFEVKQECNTWLLDVLDILKADFRLLCQDEYRESLKESFFKNTRNLIHTAPSFPDYFDDSLLKYLNDIYLQFQNDVKGNAIGYDKNSIIDDRCKVHKLKDEIRSVLKNVTDSHITPRTAIHIYSLVTEMFTLLSDADTNNQFPLARSHLFYNGHDFPVKTEDYHSTNFVKHVMKSVDWDDLEVAPVCEMLCQSGVISSRQCDSMMEYPPSAWRKLKQIIIADPFCMIDFVQVLKADSVGQDFIAERIIRACDEYFKIHTNSCMGNCDWLLNICVQRNSSLKETLLSSIKETVAPRDKSARDIYFKLKDSNSPENRIKPLLESVQSGNDTRPGGVYQELGDLTKKRLNEIKDLLKEQPTPRTMRHLYQTIDVYFEEVEDIQRLPSLRQQCQYGNLNVSRYKAPRTLRRQNLLNDFTQCVLQPMWCKLVKDIEIEPVADYLYQNRQISLYELNELTGGGNRDARARELLNIVGERPESLATFVQAMKQISVEPKQSEEVRRIHGQLVKEILQVCDGYFMIDFEKHDEVVEELRTEKFVSQAERKQQVLDEIKETVLPDESTVRDIYFEMEDSTAPENLAIPLLREVKSSVRNKRDVNAEELKKEMNNMKEKRKNEIYHLRQETSPTPQKMRQLYQLVKMYFEECKTIEEIGEIVDREVRRNTEATQIFGETEVKQLFHPTDEEEKRFEDTEVKQLASESETEVKETLDTTEVKQVGGDMEETAVKYV